MDVKCRFGQEFGGFETEEVGAREGDGGVFCLFCCHGLDCLWGDVMVAILLLHRCCS